MRKTTLQIPLLFALAKLVLHLLTNTRYGFHRDELLYLELGKHLDWGYWSNPPFIGFLSFLSQNLFGDSLFATRLFPALFGAGIVYLTCQVAKDLGGKSFAQILSGITAFTSLAYLRSSHMFMPVVVDIFFWSLCSWLVIRYLWKEDQKYLLWLGAAIGVGFLNKYSMGFLILALAIAFLVTPARSVFSKKNTWFAAGIALLIVLPNLIWQWQYNFPVISHMGHLAESQLSTVNPLIFLLDQLLMHFAGMFVWVPGLFFLLLHKNMKKFRVIGWTYLVTLLLFLVMSGKNYYTLGAYPMLMAAGGVFWETTLRSTLKRAAIAAAVVLLNLPLLPAGLPILSLDQSLKFFDYVANDLGVTSLTRWERGNIEALPQDYADMFGWEEIGRHVDTAIEEAGGVENCFIYAENYGFASAIGRFSKYAKTGDYVSFADSYRLWAPLDIGSKMDVFIYVNHEMGEDVQALFSNIKLIGEMEHPQARERGVQVYLCREPVSDTGVFWKERVESVRASFVD